MKKSLFFCIAILGAAVLFLSFIKSVTWFKAGNKPNSYEMGIKNGEGINGSKAASIKSIESRIKGFGTFMQQCNSEIFLGKRIKLTGYVKSQNVKSWAGLWLRVDQSESMQPLSFDNMNDRPIKGTTDWTKYEIILDVPQNASKLAYGALLSGTGQIWFDNFGFDIIDETTTQTQSIDSIKTSLLNKPSNLDFEE